MLAASTRAHADEAALLAAVARAAERYYAGEDACNGVYVGLGATGIGIGALLATRSDPGLRAAGYPVMAVGGIQLAIGVVYLALTPAWRESAFGPLAAHDARGFRAAELERLRALESGFPYYKLSEGLIGLGGLGMGIAGAARGDATLTGVGTGLGIAAALQLVMEHSAHDVAKDYLRALERFDLELGSVGEDGAEGMRWSGAF